MYYPDMKDYITFINENQNQNRKLKSPETVIIFLFTQFLH